MARLDNLGEQVLAMKDAGRSWSEIAKRLGISVAHAKSVVAQEKSVRRAALAKVSTASRDARRMCRCGHRNEVHLAPALDDYGDPISRSCKEVHARWNDRRCGCRDFVEAGSERDVPDPYPTLTGRYSGDARIHALVEDRIAVDSGRRSTFFDPQRSVYEQYDNWSALRRRSSKDIARAGRRLRKRRKRKESA